MYSLRRTACGLLASPAPIPLRSRLTAVPRAHRLVISRRTFLQSKWARKEAKSPLGSKESAATTTSSMATATATNTNTTATADALGSSIEVGTKAVEEEKVKRDSEDGMGTAITASTDSAPTYSSIGAEAGKPQELDQDSDTTIATSTTTATTDTVNDEHKSTSNFDVSQIREAADQEAGAWQNASGEKKLTEGKKLDLLRRAQYVPKETIFIGNLFYDVTADDLREQMSKYGAVEGVNIIYDSRGISKGYGYVQFDCMASARRAIEAMHMRIFEGRRVTLYYAQTNIRSPTNPSAPTNTLYVGNMPFEMTDRDLNDLFKDIVNVIDIRVTVDRQSGQFRGYVHVEFVDIESAAIALEKLSLRAPYNRKLKVSYSFNIRKAQHGHFPVGA